MFKFVGNSLTNLGNSLNLLAINKLDGGNYNIDSILKAIKTLTDWCLRVGIALAGVSLVIGFVMYAVADVDRNLSFKQKEKGLSTGEKKMLINAKQILVSELVLAEHSSYEEMEGIVDNKINQSFKEFKVENVDTISPLSNVVNKFIPFDDTQD